jgi:hypothetical protein
VARPSVLFEDTVGLFPAQALAQEVGEEMVIVIPQARIV